MGSCAPAQTEIHAYSFNRFSQTLNEYLHPLQAVDLGSHGKRCRRKGGGMDTDGPINWTEFLFFKGDRGGSCQHFVAEPGTVEGDGCIRKRTRPSGGRGKHSPDAWGGDTASRPAGYFQGRVMF